MSLQASLSETRVHQRPRPQLSRRQRESGRRCLSWVVALSLLINILGPIGYGVGASLLAPAGGESVICHAGHGAAESGGAQHGFRPHCPLCLFVLFGNQGLAQPVSAVAPLPVPTEFGVLTQITPPQATLPPRRIVALPLIPRAPPGTA